MTQDKIGSVKKSETHRQTVRTQRILPKILPLCTDTHRFFENRHENPLSLVSETPPLQISHLKKLTSINGIMSEISIYYLCNILIFLSLSVKLVSSFTLPYLQYDVFVLSDQNDNT
jgi:hypothetical protein